MIRKYEKKIAGFFLLGLGLVVLPLVIESPYVLHILTLSTVNVVLGIGFAMLLNCGMISLGTAAFWAIGGYASALLVMKLGFSFWLALPLSGIISGLFGLVLGGLIVKLDKGAFLVMTLAINAVLVEVLGHVELFGGWEGITRIPVPDPICLPFGVNLAFVTKTSFYYLAVFLLLLTILTSHALYSSRIGRAWRAINLSKSLAQSLGISVFRYRLTAFVVQSFFVGLTGSFSGHYTGVLTPETFSVFRSIYIQFYVILGGADYLLAGPAVGAIIMTLLPEYLRVIKESEPLVTGAFIILLAIFCPGGMLGLVVRTRLLGVGFLAKRASWSKAHQWRSNGNREDRE